jgi:small multidrug resistance pump
MTWITLSIAIIFNAAANILIKAGMQGGGNIGLPEMMRQRFLSLPMLGGMACFILALAAYSYVLSRMNLSVAYPIMTSAGFAIIYLAAVIFFHETIKMTQIIGVVLVSLGIYFISK